MWCGGLLIKQILFVVAISSCFVCLKAGSPQEWQERTIYQIVTDRFAPNSIPSSPCSNLSSWCGGTFQGIINQLDYILGMGFDAIWISPVTLQAPGGYHGYWQINIYEIDPHFGSKQDLMALVNACHQKGIWVMLDVVANHVGCPECYGCTTCSGDFSLIYPFNDASYYHPICQITNWNNATNVEVCRLANLPDLNQDDSFVSSTLIQWINQMITNYSIDGIRVDTVPEVLTSFWGQYTQSAGVYSVGEVFNGDVTYVAGFQPYFSGLLSYPLYYQLINAFAYQQNMNILQTLFQQYESSGINNNYLGTFVDNQDNPRFLNLNDDYQLYKNALTVVLTTIGIPIIYYGTEQAFNGGNDPNDRESLWPYFNTNALFYQFIALINDFRAKAQFYYQPQVQRYSTNNFYAYTRGNVFVATTNEGQGNNLNYPITYQPYSDGTVICNLFWPTTDCITVQNGQFQVYLDNGESKIYYPQDLLNSLNLNMTILHTWQKLDQDYFNKQHNIVINN